MEEKINPEATFNQAAYQQQRINELLLRVDRLNINALMWNPDFASFNYQIMFRDLCSVLVTISAKLGSTEKEEMIQDKEVISKLISSKSIFERRVVNGKTKERRTIIYDSNWEELNKLLFDFRIKLEELIDTHGFGNPSKEDPTKAIISS